MQGYLIEIPGHELAELVENAAEMLDLAKDDRKHAAEVVAVRERRLHYLEVLLALDRARQDSIDNADTDVYVIDAGTGPRAVGATEAKAAGVDALCYARFRNGEQFK